MNTPPDELQAEMNTPKQDDRPKRYSWAPGNYWHECPTCSEAFWGDKRAGLCADCAYSIMGTIEEHPPEALNAELTSLRATIAELREERARLDWLEALLWSNKIGNGIALFPGTLQATGEKIVCIHDMGDEDGSNLGDELSPLRPTLRDAIDAARQPSSGREG